MLILHSRLIAWLLVAVAASLAHPAQAQPRSTEPLSGPPSGHRTALVIGNADYDMPGADLANVTRDAEAMTAALGRLGFTVVHGLDLSHREMDETVHTFAEAAQEASVALIYYAGHGVEIDGRSYLIPSDATIETAADVRYQAVAVDQLLQTSCDAAAGLSILLLDTNRNNPFQQSRSFGGTGGPSGMGLSQTPCEHLIVYSTAPGETASDGLSGQGSPFTEAILAEMDAPGIEVLELFRRVSAHVWDATSEMQRPTLVASYRGFYTLTPQHETR